MNYFTWILFVGVATTTYTSLTAEPVYAAKYKLGDQIVYVYGDEHQAHKLFEKQESIVLEQFLNALKKSKENVLLLLEDTYGLKHKEIFDKLSSDDDAFLPKLIKHTLRDQVDNNLSHVHAESVDLRAEVILFETMLKTHSNLQNALEKNPFAYAPNLEEMRQTIGTTKVTDFIFKPILYLQKMISETKNNQKVVDILTRIQKLLIQRYATYSTIFEKIGINDYETLTVAELCNNTTLESERENLEKHFLYWRLLHAFNMCHYCNDIVEAHALSRIALAADTHKKIVVVLGDHHVAKLEEYLQEVGYELVDQEGINNRNALQKAENGLYELLAEAVKEDITFIGDRTDRFCMRLHYSTATCNKDPEEVKKYKQQRIEKPFDIESLVSSETFDWINK